MHVRRVFCIGRNYADHVAEMGGHVDRDPPVFFTKPADAVMCEPDTIPWPIGTRDLHHEVEWVVALVDGGRDLSREAAAGCVGAHAVGLDLTRRDLQLTAKETGGPWDTAKAFDYSAPVSALVPGGLDTVAANTPLVLEVNGKRRQTSTVDHMIWTVPALLAELSRLFELKCGDLVFTGTPAGVASLAPGDKLDARLGSLARLTTAMGRP